MAAACLASVCCAAVSSSAALAELTFRALEQPVEHCCIAGRRAAGVQQREQVPELAVGRDLDHRVDLAEHRGAGQERHDHCQQVLVRRLKAWGAAGSERWRPSVAVDLHAEEPVVDQPFEDVIDAVGVENPVDLRALVRP